MLWSGIFYWVFALKRKFSLQSKKTSHFVDIPAWLKLLLQHSKWLPPKYLSWPCFVHRHPKARDFKLISSKKELQTIANSPILYIHNFFKLFYTIVICALFLFYFELYWTQILRHKSLCRRQGWAFMAKQKLKNLRNTKNFTILFRISQIFAKIRPYIHK